MSCLPAFVFSVTLECSPVERKPHKGALICVLKWLNPQAPEGLREFTDPPGHLHVTSLPSRHSPSPSVHLLSYCSSSFHVENRKKKSSGLVEQQDGVISGWVQSKNLVKQRKDKLQQYLLFVLSLNKLCRLSVWKWEKVGRWVKGTQLTKGLAFIVCVLFFCF